MIAKVVRTVSMVFLVSWTIAEGHSATLWEVNDLASYFGPTAVCTVSRLRVREQPNLSSRSVGHLNLAQLVEVLEVDRNGCTTIDGIESCWVRIQNALGETGWVFGGYLEDLFSAIGNNDLVSVRALLAGGVDPNVPKTAVAPVCDSVPVTTYPLNLAQSVDVIEALVAAGASIDAGEITNDIATSPLSSAIRKDRVSVVEALLRRGANVNRDLKPMIQDMFTFQDPPLSEKMLGALIDGGFDVNMKDEELGWTPLMYCAYRSNEAKYTLQTAGYDKENVERDRVLLNCMKMLRKAGAREEEMERVDFIESVKRDTSSDTLELVKKMRDINFLTPEGTPLEVIFKWSTPNQYPEKIKVAKLLIERGASLKPSPNIYVDPLLFQVISDGHVEAVRLLISAGVDAHEPRINNSMDEDENQISQTQTPLQLCEENIKYCTERGRAISDIQGGLKECTRYKDIRDLLLNCRPKKR